MRTITAPSTALDGISDEDLWDSAQLLAIVDESIKMRLNFLKLVSHHPLLEDETHSDVSQIKAGNSAIHEAISLATKEHLVRAGAVGNGGVDMDAVRDYCQNLIDTRYGRKQRWIY